MKKRFTIAIALMFGFATLCGAFVSKRFEAAASSAKTASDLVSMMPNANFVSIIDMQQVFNSKIFTSIIKDPKSAAEFQKFETEAARMGFDIRQMRYLAVGGDAAASGKLHNFFALLVGNFDREKIMSSIAVAGKVNVRSESYGDSTIYFFDTKTKELKDPINELKEVADLNAEDIAVTFLAQDTIFFGTINSVKNALDVRAGKQSGLMGNPEMSAYISRANASALLRFAVKVPPKDTAKAKGKTLNNDDLSSEGQSSNSQTQPNNPNDPFGMTEMIESIEAGYGSLDLSSGFAMDTNLVIKSEPEAKQMAEGLNGLLALGKMMGAGQVKDQKQAKLLNDVLSGISITGAGRDVKIVLNFSEALVNEVTAMIEAEAKKSSPQTAK